MAYISTRDRLWVNCLNKDQRARTCGYWYCLESYCTPITAFRTRAKFVRWLELFNLEIEGGEVPQEGIHAGLNVKGIYREASHMDRAEFEAIPGKPILWLSNAEYTQGRLLFEPEGVCVVHYLNPNVRDRPNYDFQMSEQFLCAGRWDDFPPVVDRRWP